MATLPPGQYRGHRFVIYTINGIPEIHPEGYIFRFYGEVERDFSMTLEEMKKESDTELNADFHCVTRWSIENCRWKGIPFSRLADRAGVRPGAAFVYAHCLDGYTTVMPLENMNDAILALKLNGNELSRGQGYPVRLVVPSLYGWKSAKWVHALELLNEYRDGYWEERGYHERGDFTREERFSDPQARFIHKKVSSDRSAGSG